MLVIDPICGPASTAAIGALDAGGRLVNLGGAAAESATFDSATLRSRSLAILGYTNAALSSEESAGMLRAVLDHAASGSLTVSYEAVPLSDIGLAWARQAGGKARGRIVLRVGQAG